MRLALSFAVGLFCLLAPLPAHAQLWGTLEGTVTETSDDMPIPGVTVLVNGTNFGTATDADGAYSLRLPAGTHAIRFSSVGYRTRIDSVRIRDEETTHLNVDLVETVVEMDELTVEDDRAPREAGVYRVDPQDVQNIPTPFKDGLRALKTVPGVATNNELSQQYSVRGGGYNENLIFIDGFEVFMPFRPRQGEQEGLGLLNPDLAESITFYTGGFPARYGGKLSSALDVQYDQPTDQPITGAASVSTLDASLHAKSSALDGKLGWSAGARFAQPGRFFGTQDLKGDYNPRFVDGQALATYRFSDRVSLEALGIYADHTFELEPSERETYFGMISLNPAAPSDFNVLWSQFNGARQDGYTTSLLGTRLTTDVSDRLRIEHSASYFGTVETENFDIAGDARVISVDPVSGEWGPVEGRNRNVNFADNRVEVQRLTGGGTYGYRINRNAFEGGWHLRGLRFNDQLNENTRIEDVNGEDPDIVIQDLRDTATFNEMQAGFYLQDAVDVLPQRDRLLVTAGVRSDYYSFNDEWTVSPRLSARLTASEQLTLNASWGVYYQKPTYRELRGTPGTIGGLDETSPDGSVIEGALNRDLRSQRSIQYVLGGEYFFPERRLYLRAEAYYKDLDNIVSYTIDDIRVDYSGENDANGFAYGVDLQLRGEFVPGLESWFNYSFLVARERFTEASLDRLENSVPSADVGAQLRDNRSGLVPRPTDQRHTFSAFIQDYVPGDESWKLHMRLLYGSGLPYTPPDPGPRTSTGAETRIPGERMSGRLPDYRRVDVGATKEIKLVSGEGTTRAPVVMDLTVELLNMFDMDNTVTYTWEGNWTRIPKRLTPRTLNARVRLTF